MGRLMTLPSPPGSIVKPAPESPVPANHDEDVEHIIQTLAAEDRSSSGELVPDVYRELRAVAGALLRRERPDHTLQATALVHEAYLRLAHLDPDRWNDRAHFFRVAARAMRRILVNHAERRGRLKRGGDRHRMTLFESDAVGNGGVDLVELDDALERLGGTDASLARVVELRFFGGCTNAEVAETLGVSTRTVEREWRLARAWLRAELAPEDGPS